MTEKIIDEVVWMASFRYGRPNLSKIIVLKRTSKSIYVKSGTDILGATYYGKRINTGYCSVFDTPEQALYFLIDEANKHKAELERSMVDLEKTLNVLRRTLDRMKQRRNDQDIEAVVSED